MKIVVAGNGKVGSTLARELIEEENDVTIIDQNANVLENGIEKFDVMGVHGNCASREVLLSAGIRDADMLIAVTNADEINLLSCLTAHGINPKLHTIARIRNPEYINQIYEMQDVFPLSMALNPERQAALEIERLLKLPGFLRRDTFAKGRVQIVELRVGANSKLCDVALNDMYAIAKCKVLVCAVLRDGNAITPDGNFVLREGDRLFVTAMTNNLMTLLKNLGIITHKVRKVILCGGSRLGFYLAKRLVSGGISVRIIEKNYERCIALAEQLPEVSIVHGDASDQNLLEREHIEKCDAVVSLTGLDELNILISMYASNCGVSQLITQLDHVGNTHIIDSLSLGSIISPKELSCNTIVQYVRAMKNQTGAAVSVHNIADGHAEAMEFLADESCKYCGRPLKELKLRQNVLIACLTHRGKIEIPNGESSFEAGDTVVVVSSNEQVIYRLNDIFE